MKTEPFTDMMAFRLDKNIRQELKTLAHRLMVSESSLMRQAILGVLRKYGVEAYDRRTWSAG